MTTAPSDLTRLAAGTLVEQETFADVEVTRLAGVEFDRCRFERCRFIDAALSRVVFERCTFVECDLTRVAFGDSSLRGVRFEDCKLFAVDFARAGDNPDVVFERSILRCALFHGINLRTTRFASCQLQEASFLDSDLQDADFAGSELDNATFRRCSLAGADFSTTTGLVFEPAQNQSRDALIGVDTAIQLARAVGLRVAGYDDARSSKRKSPPARRR